MKREQNIIDWAEGHGIFEKSNPLKQIGKTQEELTETRDAILALDVAMNYDHDHANDCMQEIKDGIGDQVVTLVILAKMHGWTLEECIEHAWQEIKDRTGKMEGGVFVKD